ncbi:D-lactonohydrolase-like protein [Fomitiporia mediterranea MF3/22]|uniref:D-lactonohydrolase-like protein n=1 Tax=Fomitiporia mediterranea (strain MF3/22) TaxID=694068 RepID=UPI00044082AD|nr:D-lactonohydrolase-like protein [Fomitiporia mediterranea MF3/22]EJD07762.1 D-lactonohydrolase-like protein [Fomitiporia mediterranea MF3/22]
MFQALVVTLLGVKLLVIASNTSVPDGAVRIDPVTFAVIGTNGTFRDDDTPFNPTNSSPPVFQVFSDEFLDVLGPAPSIRVIAENNTFAFAHEAPVYISASEDFFFASNGGGALGYSGLNQSNQYSKINLKEADGTSGLVNYTKITLSNDLQMMNGATLHQGNILLMSQGRGNIPATMALLNPFKPYNTTVLLDNFYGRQFNSLNDVKVHPTSKAFFFCDVAYGYYQNFRPTPDIPNQVYRYDPKTRAVRVVADGLNKPNGIAFSADGKTAFVSLPSCSTDTGAASAAFGTNWTLPSTIYKYDVEEGSQSFANRRVFAYSDNGIPDGIQLDSKGNVYAGCGDGVHVWNPSGELVGKFFLGSLSANMAFAGPGRLVILAETRIYLAKIAASGQNLENL